jgi:hypothetical protein
MRDVGEVTRQNVLANGTPVAVIVRLLISKGIPVIRLVRMGALNDAQCLQGLGRISYGAILPRQLPNPRRHSWQNDTNSDADDNRYDDEYQEAFQPTGPRETRASNGRVTNRTLPATRKARSLHETPQA